MSTYPVALSAARSLSPIQLPHHRAMRVDRQQCTADTRILFEFAQSAGQRFPVIHLVLAALACLGHFALSSLTRTCTCQQHYCEFCVRLSEAVVSAIHLDHRQVVQLVHSLVLGTAGQMAEEMSDPEAFARLVVQQYLLEHGMHAGMQVKTMPWSVHESRT